MKMHLKQFLFFVAITCCSLFSTAQDLIIKNNGDSIQAQVIEVGTNTITYKKLDLLSGPSFVENKLDIRLIKYSNGQVQYFGKAEIAADKKKNLTKELQKGDSTKTASATASQPSNGKVKIEFVNNKYTINGVKASRKEVDKQLGKSKNPAILVPLKAGKIVNTSQKISKFTSIPSTIGGGSAFLVTLADLINDARRHRDNTNTYFGPAISLVGTLALPITSKLLKKQGDKTREKLIELYNVTN